MTQQPSDRWLHDLDLDQDQVRDAVSALSAQDREAVATAARAPLGELVEIDQYGQPAGPLPVSESLTASGCVFALRMNEGEYPREHHWLTHLGWAVARQMQPTVDIPVDARRLSATVTMHQTNLRRNLHEVPTVSLGKLLHQTRGQIALCVPGTDPETALFIRLCQSMLCELIDARAGGSPTPLAAGGYDDAPAEMVRQAIILSVMEDDEAAFELADMAGLPDAFAARRRIYLERLQALRDGAQD